MTSALSIGLALFGGILTVLSPCVLPVLPILVGRSLQSHRYGPIAMGIGLTSGFALTGSLLGITTSWFTGLAIALRGVAIALLLGLGVLSIFPEWGYRAFGRIMQPSHSTKLGGLAGEFWIGTQLGVVWTPCAGSVLGSILVLAAVHHQVLSAFTLLFVYGIGASLPMMAIAYGGRYFSRRLLKLRPRAIAVQKVGGVIIVATAIAILLGWDVQIQLWLAPLFPSVSI